MKFNRSAPFFKGVHELPEKEYGWMVHWNCISRLRRWYTEHAPNDIGCIQSR